MSDHKKKKTTNKSKIKDDVAEFLQQIKKNKPGLPLGQYFAEFREYADKKQIDWGNKDVVVEYWEQLVNMLEKGPDWKKNEDIIDHRKCMTR